MLGPFSKKPITNLRISPIGLVPKSENGWRLITHLSYPEKASVNHFIPDELCKVNYTSLDNVLDMVAELGKSALIAKVDISQAFRLLIINPADFDLLGIWFDNKFYIDKCLPFGCSIACSLFEKFSTFLHWLVTQETNLNTLDHYLDDFIFAGKSDTSDCATLMNKFLEISAHIGVPIAGNKTVYPTTVLTFLGFEIDTDLMLIRLPAEKLIKLKTHICNLLPKKKCRIKVFESMVGLMSYCSRALPSARAFLRRFYDLLASVPTKRPHYFIRISQEVKADAYVWLEFLNNFNGSCFIPEKFWTSNDTMELFTDATASATLGCGAYLSGQYLQYKWPSDWVDKGFLKDITFLELVPVVMALYAWAPHFQNKKILFRIDNEALCVVINKRTSKSKLVMQLIRPLVLFTLCNNTQFKAKHIPGTSNQIADSLSRFQERRFRNVAPYADLSPTPIPISFLDIISNLK